MKSKYVNALILALVLVVFLISIQSAFGQQQFATAITSENEVENSGFAIDADLLTSAVVNANSGLALGVGAYSGHIELQFPGQIPANQTSYVRFNTEDDLLPYLLGGNLGGLLADVAGLVLLGNQEFTIDVRNNNTSLYQEDSGITDAFVTNSMRVVSDKNGNYFMAISPNEEYNSIRVQNKVGSLIGLGTTKELNVYGAFTSDDTFDCLNANYTSFDGSGITLDLLSIAGTGVTNPEFAIDDDVNTYSELGFGIINVAATIRQTIYFDGSSDSTDVFYVTLGVDPSLLQLGVLNNIQLSADNGTNTDVYTGNLASILSVDLLGLLSNSGTVTIPVEIGESVDRISIDLSSLLGVNLNQSIRIYDVFSAPIMPEIAVNSQNVAICEGASASLMATTATPGTTELLWYDAEKDGNLLAVLGSGETFETSALTTSTTYYVSARRIGCLNESPRVPVTVTVSPIPTATDIEVNTNSIYCSSNDVVLVSTSDINGTYEWFFDSNATNQITHNMVDGDVTYTITDSGTLTISGLGEGDSPYDYFVRLRTNNAECINASGDLKTVNVTVVDSNFDIESTLDTVISVQDILNVNNTNTAISLEGSVSGDASEGDSVTIRINDLNFTGILDANLAFNIEVPGIDVLSDLDNAVELLISSGLCTVTEQLPIPIPEFPTEVLLQVFCASDNPTILDLQLNLEDGVFFDALVGGTVLGADTPLVDGGVYFSGLLNLPVDVFARVAISVQIIDVEAPTAEDGVQTFCDSSSPTIGDLQVDQNEVVFYDSAVGGNILDPNATLVAGDYFVSRIENGCESENRLQITAFIIEESPVTLMGQTEEACVSTESYTYFTESNQSNYEWTVTGGVIMDGGTAIDDFVTVTWNSLQDTSIEVAYLSTDTCTPNKILIVDIETMRCGEVLGAEFCLEVYNEFSPNGDGFNDFFEVECITDYANTTRVYNRNGNLVFETQNYQNDWNGIATVSGVLNRGDHLPAGTYYYTINIPELNRDLVGWLHLAR
ncbi:gliding motility-associated C-terminal domain-containing protein [Maribacter dokdonensis]|uniref:Ig-like domain-containing protein n=1 Tax=Maribacter dokdonensis TaxID=320912 RepID=UPI001C08569A|nr:gliding motility-associated C-terminal domain-containing protein [Maribacter dokdonensis]MBU2899704.1 gliding motility-associated C-terminal domain-containing protein [Maribacter dokdonensis]